MVLALKFSKAIFETARPMEMRVEQMRYLYQLLFTVDGRGKEKGSQLLYKAYVQAIKDL